MGLLAPGSFFGLSRISLVLEVIIIIVLKEPAEIGDLGIQGMERIVVLGMQWM